MVGAQVKKTHSVEKHFLCCSHPYLARLSNTASTQTLVDKSETKESNRIKKISGIKTSVKGDSGDSKVGGSLKALAECAEEEEEQDEFKEEARVEKEEEDEEYKKLTRGYEVNFTGRKRKLVALNQVVSINTHVIGTIRVSNESNKFTYTRDAMFLKLR